MPQSQGIDSMTTNITSNNVIPKTAAASNGIELQFSLRVFGRERERDHSHRCMYIFGMWKIWYSQPNQAIEYLNSEWHNRSGRKRHHRRWVYTSISMSMLPNKVDQLMCSGLNVFSCKAERWVVEYKKIFGLTSFEWFSILCAMKCYWKYSGIVGITRTIYE